MNSGIPSLKAAFVFLFMFCAALIACNNNTNDNNRETVKPVNAKIYSKTADSLLKLVSAYPDSAIYRQQLIVQLETDNELDEALKHNDTLLKIIGDNAVIWFNRASLLEAKNDTANAIAAFEKSISLQNPYPVAQLRLAKLYAETKNPKALQMIDFMFRNEQAFGVEIDLILLRGIYYKNTREFDKAITCFDQSIKERYTFMEAYIEKGSLLYDLKKYKESYSVFYKATTINNTFADGYYWMAKNQEALNQKEEAIGNYKRAVALDTDFTEAKEALKRLEGK